MQPIKSRKFWERKESVIDRLHRWAGGRLKGKVLAIKDDKIIFKNITVDDVNEMRHYQEVWNDD